MQRLPAAQLSSQPLPALRTAFARHLWKARLLLLCNYACTLTASIMVRGREDENEGDALGGRAPAGKCNTALRLNSGATSVQMKPHTLRTEQQQKQQQDVLVASIPAVQHQRRAAYNLAAGGCQRQHGCSR